MLDLRQLVVSTSEAELKQLIRELNHDDEVDGIIVQVWSTHTWSGFHFSFTLHPSSNRCQPISTRRSVFRLACGSTAHCLVKVCQEVVPSKDVDGFHYGNMGERVYPRAQE